MTPSRPCASVAAFIAITTLATSLCAQQGSPPPELAITVDEAVTLALRNNLALRAAALDEEIERAKIREALGAYDPVLFGSLAAGQREVLFPANFPLDPKDPGSPTVTRIISQSSDNVNSDLGVRGVLETGLTYELVFRSDYSKRDEGTGLNPIHNNSTSLSLTQPLLRGAWSAYGEAQAEAARLQSLGAHQSWRGSVRDKIREVQGAYYDLVFANWDLEVKRQSLNVADQQVELTRVRVETGTLPKIEMTSAESGRAGRRVDLVTSESKVVEAEDRLRRLVLDFTEAGAWDQRLTPSETPVELDYSLKGLDEIVAMAEKSEPDLLRSHLAVAQAEIVLGQRENERQAKLDLTGQGDVVGLDNEFWEAHRAGFDRERGAATWQLGLKLEMPLGNRAAASRVAQSELALRKAKISLREARTEMVFRIRNAVRTIDVTKRSLAARKEATRLASEQLENERLKLELKTSTNYQVYQLEDLLQQRRSDEVRAILDHRLALLDLSRVTAIPLAELAQRP